MLTLCHIITYYCDTLQNESAYKMNMKSHLTSDLFTNHVLELAQYQQVTNTKTALM